MCPEEVQQVLSMRKPHPGPRAGTQIPSLGTALMPPTPSPPGQSVSIPAFDVGELLPQRLGHFYRYNGSLTTPPCLQSVLWTVFHQRVRISSAQVLARETVPGPLGGGHPLRARENPWGYSIHVTTDSPFQLQQLQQTLFSTEPGSPHPQPLLDNFREPQALNDRLVLASFPVGECWGSLGGLWWWGRKCGALIWHLQGRILPCGPPMLSSFPRGSWPLDMSCA